MFVRKGEVLGSVLHSVEPKAEPAQPDLVEEVAPPETEATDTDSGAGERPKDYDNKPEWVDYAVSKGADRAEAEGLTKPELIELYGGE